MKKSNQYSVRLDAELQAEFEEAIRITGMDPSLLLRECLKAFVAEVKETGEIRLPLAIVAKKKAAKADFDQADESLPASAVGPFSSLTPSAAPQGVHHVKEMPEQIEAPKRRGSLPRQPLKGTKPH